MSDETLSGGLRPRESRSATQKEGDHPSGFWPVSSSAHLCQRCADLYAELPARKSTKHEVPMMANERVVFAHEIRPNQGFRIVVTGEVDSDMVAAMAAYAKFQEMLVKNAPPKAAARIESDAERIRTLERDEERARTGWDFECDDLDRVLDRLGLDPQAYRTDGGRLNRPKLELTIAARRKHERELSAALRTLWDWVDNGQIEAIPERIVPAASLLATPDSAASPTGGEG